MGTRVLICGSRDWTDWPTMLFAAKFFRNGDVLIEGGARGADLMARKAVEALGYAVHIIEFPADWENDGRAAGPRRNQKMLSEGKPDVVWAFTTKALPDSKGTFDMVKRAKKAGVPVYLVSAA